MVRLQTLDLRIGVRVPASQPLILKNLPRNPLNRSHTLFAGAQSVRRVDEVRLLVMISTCDREYDGR